MASNRRARIFRKFAYSISEVPRRNLTVCEGHRRVTSDGGTTGRWRADDSEMPLIIIALKQRIVKWFGRTTCIKDLTGSAALVAS